MDELFICKYRGNLLAGVDEVGRGPLAGDVVAAASILAKVERDREMVLLDQVYPGYGLAKHKGYPTVVHIEALQRLGVSAIHRRSFGPVKKLLEAV